MNQPAPAATALPSYPVTANGKRNWAWAAVHPGEQPASRETLPDIGGSGGSFADIIDIINPLQHIPIVSSIYRAITGDTIGAPARILGGALFGGPVGMLAGIGTTVASEVIGGDPGEKILAAIIGGSAAAPAAAQQASAAYQSASRIVF